MIKIIKLILFLTFLHTSLFSQKAIIADFDADVKQGCGTILVRFSNTTSPETGLNYYWDFGNGETSDIFEPVIAFTQTGSFDVQLIATDGIESDTIKKEDFIIVFEGPEADFSILGELIGCAPYSITFNDNSTNGDAQIISRHWDFGDGSVSDELNPEHTFLYQNNFVVSLIVIDENNCQDIFRPTEHMSVFKPFVEFEADQTYVCSESLEVNFTNLSNGEGALTYEWDFGDGNTSNDENPTNLYDERGEFDVELIVEDIHSCKDSLVKQNYININKVIAEFNNPRDTVCLNELIIFNNTSLYGNTYFWDFGDGFNSDLENPSHSYDEAGDYTIILTTYRTGDCFSTYSKTINVETVTADFEPDIRFSCSTPIIVNYTNNSQNAHSYEWHFGNLNVSTEFEPSNQINWAGIYNDKLIAISKHGCKDSLTIDSSVVIIEPSAYFTPNIWVDPFGLKGCAPLTIDFENASTYNTNRDNIISYSWNFSDGTQSNEENPSHTFNNVGQYIVNLLIITELGCNSSYSQLVLTGTEQIADFSKINADNICASELVEFIDESEDSNLIDEWYWSFGDGNYSNKQNPTHLYTDTGSMSVSLQAFHNGCPGYISKEDYIYIKGPLVNPTYNVECSNTYRAFFQANAKDFERVYWDFGDGSDIDSINLNPSHLYSDNINYTINLNTVNTTNNCSYLAQRTVIIKDPKANFSRSQINNCADVDVGFNGKLSSDHAYFQYLNNFGRYLWDFGAGSEKQISFDTLSHTYNTHGTYDVKLVVKDFRGCGDSIIKKVYIYKPNVDFSVTDTFGCLPFSGSFQNLSTSDTSIIAWNWDFGDESNSTEKDPIHMYSDIGKHNVSLSATDFFGCQSSITKETFIETISPIPDFTADDNTVCIGDSVKFTSLYKDNAVSFFWNFGDGNTSTEADPTHAYLNSGNYNVSLNITDVYGCDSTNVLNNYVSVQDYPTTYFTADTLFAYCYPLEVNFSDTTNNAEVSNWYWEFGDESTSNLQNPKHFYTKPGDYPTSLIVNTSNGCADTLLKENYIQINAPYAEYIVSDTVCEGEAALFIAHSFYDVDEIEWIFGDGVTSFEDTVYHSYTAAGFIYPTLILKNSDINACDIYITDSVYNIRVFSDIGVKNDQYNGCAPLELEFFSGNTNAENIMWDFGDGQLSNEEEPTHTFITEGFYEVELILSDNTGCYDTTVTYIDVFPVPVLDISNDTTICSGDDVQLFASGADNYEWLPDIFLDDNLIFNPVSSPDSRISYTLTGTDLKNCKSTKSITVDIQREPQVNFNDTLVIIGEEVHLNAYADDILSYLWSPGEYLNCIDCSEVIATPLEPTNYEITLVDIHNCFELTYSFFIDVIEAYTLDVPKAFTPNGDGVNDVVYVKGWGIKELLFFKIYNRFGELVFETNDISNGWDGSYKGNSQNIETFKYIVSVKSYDGNIINKRGTIKIIK